MGKSNLVGASTLISEPLPTLKWTKYGPPWKSRPAPCGINTQNIEDRHCEKMLPSLSVIAQLLAPALFTPGSPHFDGTISSGCSLNLPASCQTTTVSDTCCTEYPGVCCISKYHNTIFDLVPCFLGPLAADPGIYFLVEYCLDEGDQHPCSSGTRRSVEVLGTAGQFMVRNHLAKT